MRGSHADNRQLIVLDGRKGDFVMASVSFTEKEYLALFGAAIDLEERGDTEDAAILDKLAQKMNTALSRSALSAAPRAKSMDGVAEFQAPSPLDTYRNTHTAKAVK